MEKVKAVGRKVGGGMVGKVKTGGWNESNGQKNSWEREGKVRQEKAKQVHIWTDKKREMGNNGL